jgi:3-hydroxyisobutyrate dehydrogenase-like beta-hydroxyacid dehydrogenase
MAAAGKLFVVAAGDSAALDDCMPLFDVLGQKVSRIGADPSAANLVKLSGNFLQAAVIEGLGEAIALVGKAGIDTRAYVDLLTSTVFTAPAYKIFGPLIAEGTFEPAAFAAPLGYKDIRLTIAAAETLRVPMPLASLLRDRFVRLFAHGGEHLDWTAIGGLAAQDAGYSSS